MLTSEIINENWANWLDIETEEFTIPDEYTEIVSYTFNKLDDEKRNLFKTVKLPKNLQIIGEAAFINCNLESVDFSQCSSLREIGHGAFMSCILKSVNFSQCSSLRKIGERAFKIDFRAFKKHKTLTCIDFSECTNLQIICNESFGSSLKSVILPNNENGKALFEKLKSEYKIFIDFKCGNLSSARQQQLEQQQRLQQEHDRKTKTGKVFGSSLIVFGILTAVAAAMTAILTGGIATIISAPVLGVASLILIGSGSKKVDTTRINDAKFYYRETGDYEKFVPWDLRLRHAVAENNYEPLSSEENNEQTLI